MKNLVRFAILTVATTALLVSLLTGRAAVLNLTIGSYQLVSSTRATRTEFDYVYKASVTNPGTIDVVHVTATLTSKSPTTTLIDGSLTCGDVPAVKTVVCTDTFTIRQDRSVTFDPADLVWKLSGGIRPVPPARGGRAAARAAFPHDSRPLCSGPQS